MSEQFKEEYWSGALEVLKREERKAWWNRYGLWLCLGVVVLSVSAYVLWPKSGSAVAHAAMTESEEIYLRDSYEGASVQVVSDNVMEHELVGDYEPTQDQQNMELALAGSGEEAAGYSSTSEENNLATEIVESPTVNSTKATSEAEVDLPVVTSAPASINNNPQETADSTTPNQEEHLDENTESSETDSPINLSQSTKADMQILASVNLNKSKTSLTPINPRSAIQLPKLKPQLVQIKRQTKKYPLFDYKKDRLFVFAGNSLLTGYGSYKRELFFSPEVGIGYENVLAEHWSVNGSLSYFMINGVRHSADFTSTQLDFGFNSTVTTISTLKLHYAYVPVVLNYDLNRRTSFSLGAGLSYLINSRSLVTVREVDNFSENEVDRREEWGYVAGYRNLSGSLLAGYEFRLRENLTFAVNYQYGLHKITLENIYGQTSEDRNSRLRLMLKFDLK